jgi:hypothetical protein
MASGVSSTKFNDDLVRHGLIIRVDVPGIFGRTAVFEDVVARFNDLVTRSAKNNAPRS